MTRAQIENLFFSSRKVFGIVIVLFSDFGKVNIGLLSFLSVTVILTVAVLVNGGEPLSTAIIGKL
jgi:hypothetical protein